MTNYLSKLFGASPVLPLQTHMSSCFAATEELIAFFDQAMQVNWALVDDSRQRIVEAEQNADDLKREIRTNIPKKMFMPVPRADLLDLLLVQDLMANKAREVSGFVVGRRMEIPQPIQASFKKYVARNIDAARKARDSVNELDELYETGFRGAEVAIVEKLLLELDEIENDTDEMQTQIRYQLYELEKDLPPVDVMFLYRVIELVGEIADLAERIGHRLELLLSH